MRPSVKAVLGLMLKLCRKGQRKWRILTSQRWSGGWCRNQTSLFWIHLNKIVSEAVFLWCQEGSLVCEGARASYFNGLSSFLVLPISWWWLNRQVVSDSWDPMDYSPSGSSVHEISPGKNTRAGCCFLLQGIFLTQGLNLCFLHCRWILYPWATMPIS